MMLAFPFRFSHLCVHPRMETGQLQAAYTEKFRDRILQ